jgi:hypothetical protein
LVFFLSLLLFTVPEALNYSFKALADFPIGFPIVFKTIGGGYAFSYWFCEVKHTFVAGAAQEILQQF